jgi:hypothetical protein
LLGDELVPPSRCVITSDQRLPAPYRQAHAAARDTIQALLETVDRQLDGAFADALA